MIECSIEEIDRITERTFLLNCVGPYINTEEEMFKSCINTNTNYMDIPEEISFLHKIYSKYNQRCIDKGIKVIDSCRFDSLPNDICTYNLSKYFDEVNLDSKNNLEIDYTAKLLKIQL